MAPDECCSEAVGEESRISWVRLGISPLLIFFSSTDTIMTVVSFRLAQDIGHEDKLHAQAQAGVRPFATVGSPAVSGHIIGGRSGGYVHGRKNLGRVQEKAKRRLGKIFGLGHRARLIFSVTPGRLPVDIDKSTSHKNTNRIIATD